MLFIKIIIIVIIIINVYTKCELFFFLLWSYSKKISWRGVVYLILVASADE